MQFPEAIRRTSAQYPSYYCENETMGFRSHLIRHTAVSYDETQPAVPTGAFGWTARTHIQPLSGFSLWQTEDELWAEYRV